MKRFLLPTLITLLSLLAVSQFVDAENAPRAPRHVRRAARRAEREARARATAQRGLSDGLISAGRHAPTTPRLAAQEFVFDESDTIVVTSNEFIPAPCRPVQLRAGIFPANNEPEAVAVPGSIIQTADVLPPLPPRDSVVRLTSHPDSVTKLSVISGAPASRPISGDVGAAGDVLSRVVVAGELAGLVLPEPGRLDPSILQASFNQLPVAAAGAIVFGEEASPRPPGERTRTPDPAADLGDKFRHDTALSCVRCQSVDGPSEEEARIQSALNQPVSMHFAQARLSEIFGHIANSQGINIVVDDTGLATEGITTRDPVTINVDGVMLKSALGLILNSRNLGYVVEDEVLKITSRQRSEGELIAQVYSVSDLIRPAPQIGSNPFGGREVAADPVAAADFENVIELICSSIQPESWNESGGPAAIVPHPGSKSLVIRQTRRGHQEVANLLDGIRRVMQDVQSACEIEPESLPEDAVRIPVTPRIIIQEEEEELLGIPLDPLPPDPHSDQHGLQPAPPPVALPDSFDLFGIPTHDLLFRDEEPESRLILQTP